MKRMENLQKGKQDIQNIYLRLSKILVIFSNLGWVASQMFIVLFFINYMCSKYILHET